METMLVMGLGTSEIIIILLAVGMPMILSVYCLVDITQSRFRDSSNKIPWVICVLLAPVIGSLAYLIWGRNQKASAVV